MHSSSRRWAESVNRLLALLVLLVAAAAPATAQKRIAFTFDDAPRIPGAFLTPDERTAKLIDGLKRAGVRQVAFFVNPGNLSQPWGKGGEDRLNAYVAAGHVLGDHSMTHPHLNAMSAEAYVANIDQAEAFLKPHDGYRPWFRYPFLDEGGPDAAKREAVRAGLKARHLTSGFVTADGADWNMEGNAIAAVQAHKAIDMQALHDLYVESMVQGTDFYDALARRALGSQPSQVILMHETDLAALWIADVVSALRADGWEIVTADQAFADPVWKKVMESPSIESNLTSNLAMAKGINPSSYERIDTGVANRLFAERVLKEQPGK